MQREKAELEKQLNDLAFLREQPRFWTNAGGWPVPLREFVAGWFYPLLALEMLVLVGFSIACMHAKRVAGNQAIVTLPILWALFGLVLAIVIANNIENLLAGRPLHWHAR